MARRAASICRAVSRPRVVALRPNSPNDTSAPRCARPRLRPLNCFLYLVRFGCSIPVLLARRDFGRCRRRLVEHFALENPDLDADHAVSGPGFGEAIIDLRPESVQGHAALAVPLRTRDFRTVEPPADLDLHALGAEAHGVGHGALHGAAEHHATLELLGDSLGHQLRVQLRLADLGNVDAHVAHRQRQHVGDFATQLLDVLALLADHDPRPRRVDGDVGLAGRTLDLDTADGGLRQALAQQPADLVIRVQVLGEVLRIGEPAGVPLPRDTETNADWMYFLTHE